MRPAIAIEIGSLSSRRNCAFDHRSHRHGVFGVAHLRDHSSGVSVLD
jgi:hypothetical protein